MFIFRHLPPFLLDQIGIVLVVTGTVLGNQATVTSGVVILCIALAWHVFLLLTLRSGPTAATVPTGGIYADRLVEIFSDHMLLRNYYFPFLSAKRVAFADIKHIRSENPTIINGKWRIWGSGDFTTWFPLDGSRPSRDRILLAKLRNKAVRIGFTVEDSARVATVLRDKGLLR